MSPSRPVQSFARSTAVRLADLPPRGTRAVADAHGVPAGPRPHRLADRTFNLGHGIGFSLIASLLVVHACIPPDHHPIPVAQPVAARGLETRSILP